MKRALRWVQRRMLWLLLSTYVLGALAPALGLRLRDTTLVEVPGLGSQGAFSLPMLMVGVLLFVAGLAARLEQIGTTLRRPALLLAGLAANATYPLLFVAAVSVALLSSSRSADAGQNIVLGLGLVGAMPVAGASAAWSQNASGNLAMSLALVWGSTLLSPLVSPLVLGAVGLLTTGEYSNAIQVVARHGSSLFLVLAVVVPSLLGLVVQMLVGRALLTRMLPALTLLNLVDLLVLSYTNAAASLPQVVAQPDARFIVLVLGLTTAMCVGGFVIGWCLPRLFRAGRGEQTAMMFGLGMSNNGTGLVLAQATLPHHPRVLVAIIAYNVVQQIGAGLLDASQRRARRLEAS